MTPEQDPSKKLPPEGDQPAPPSPDHIDPVDATFIRLELQSTDSIPEDFDADHTAIIEAQEKAETIKREADEDLSRGYLTQEEADAINQQADDENF